MFYTQYLGSCSYPEGLKFQKKIHQDVVGKDKIYVLGCEHQACITLGIRGHESDLKPEFFNSLPVFYVDRGGKATVHGPGQLVIYPIFNLRRHKIGIKLWVHYLEEVTQNFFKNFSISVQRREKKPGLYTKKGKIVFLGLKVTKGVSFHGISININNNLNLFDSVFPCGESEVELDLMNRYGIDKSLDKLFYIWVKEFQTFFGI